MLAVQPPLGPSPARPMSNHRHDQAHQAKGHEHYATGSLASVVLVLVALGLALGVVALV